MNSFAEWLRKLGFRLPDKTPKEDAVQAEMLVRSRMYKEEFRKWITRGHHQELLKNIYTTYTLNKLGVPPPIKMLMIFLPQISGNDCSRSARSASRYSRSGSSPFASCELKSQ